jgi:hypothetical protein
MGQSIGWSGDYVKDTQDLLTSIGTLSKFNIIHEETAYEFFYDLLNELKKEEEFDGSLFEYVEEVNEDTAKKIAEILRDRIEKWIWKR